MADDVEIDFEKMKLWDADQVTYYFENGGAEPPGEWTPPPCVPLTPVRTPEACICIAHGSPSRILVRSFRVELPPDPPQQRSRCPCYLTQIQTRLQLQF